MDPFVLRQRSEIAQRMNIDSAIELARLLSFEIPQDTMGLLQTRVSRAQCSMTRKEAMTLHQAEAIADLLSRAVHALETNRPKIAPPTIAPDETTEPVTIAEITEPADSTIAPESVTIADLGDSMIIEAHPPGIAEIEAAPTTDDRAPEGDGETPIVETATGDLFQEVATGTGEPTDDQDKEVDLAIAQAQGQTKRRKARG